MRNLTVAVLTVAAAIVSASLLAADSDYYQGKNVTYIVATNAGGGYDAYARLIGGYLEEYLNADHVLIRNVPGAGHIVGANTMPACDSCIKKLANTA